MTAEDAGTITSANVVGYQQNALPGYKMMTPTFKSMTAAAVPIDEFTVKGATDGMTIIQVMNTAGQWTGMYYWFNEFTDPETGDYYPAGWMDVTGQEPAGITLNNGEAVFFFTEESGITAGNAGEVASAETVVAIPGYKMVGNSSPVALDVDKLTVQNATDGMTIIQVMNTAGQWTGMYYWFNEFTDPETGDYYPAGWMDVTGQESAGITLQPGDAVFFFTEESGITATIPSAL